MLKKRKPWQAPKPDPPREILIALIVLIAVSLFGFGFCIRNLSAINAQLRYETTKPEAINLESLTIPYDRKH